MMNVMKTYSISFAIAEANELLVNKCRIYVQNIRDHVLQRRKSPQLNQQNTPSGVRESLSVSYSISLSVTFLSF